MHIYPPGTRIAQYQVAGRPLIGGMGIVYFCTDTQIGRPVALKTWRPEFLSDRTSRDRFLREGTHWVDLGAHPHVVRCHEVVNTDLVIFLVLELVAKEPSYDDASLRSWLSSGPQPSELALLFALQVARGMAHATARIPGLVHRDLKPENLLVGADHLSQASVNRLRVTDFGLASVLAEVGLPGGEQPAGGRLWPKWLRVGQERRTSDKGGKPAPGGNDWLPRRTQLTHGAVGTPLYMAPEQWKGQMVTTATDEYAPGCILFEMLTGRPAAAGGTPEALREAHCSGRLRALPAGIAGTVRQIVARCLAQAPGDR